MLTLNNATKNYRRRFIGSGASHISQILKLLSWVHRTSDSHQIWYLGCILTLSNTARNNRHRSTVSGTSHISQMGKLWSWAHGTSDSHQIWYLGLYTNSKWHYEKLSLSVHRVRYLPYKLNRYTEALRTLNVRFAPNLIFMLAYQL